VAKLGGIRVKKVEIRGRIWAPPSLMREGTFNLKRRILKGGGGGLTCFCNGGGMKPTEGAIKEGKWGKGVCPGL